MRHMNDTSLADRHLFADFDLRATTDWLSTPIAAQAEDELLPLHTHLSALHEMPATTGPSRDVLDRIYERAETSLRQLLPAIGEASLPLSRRTRHTVRDVQGILLLLAEAYEKTLTSPTGERAQQPERATWRALDALARHLQVSSHIAAPYAPGVWKAAHRLYLAAITGNYADTHLPEAQGTITDTYLRANLLACAQPASFTGREIGFVVDYIERFGNRAGLLNRLPAELSAGLFWIDPVCDAPPTSANRRPPPPSALCFSCDALAQLADEQGDALQAGAQPGDLDLPEHASGLMTSGILHRLAQHWGQPGKRRFPRRRQNYRAELCIGLPRIWKLLDGRPADDNSAWLVTNESPDGYAVMHTSGKTGRLVAGDIVAIRTEGNTDWQVCITRWILSDNPEHIELGLQILAPRAMPAVLVLPRASGGSERRPVLALPALPHIRPEESLVAAAGTLAAGGERMILIVERDNIEVRELKATQLIEQTASVDLIAVTGEHAP